MYSLLSASDICSAGTRRTVIPANRPCFGNEGRSRNAAAMGRPVIPRSAGRPSSASTVGAGSNIVGWVPLPLPGRTRAPQAAKTPSSRCQYAAVLQFREERSQERSSPHLNPWSDCTRSVAWSSSARRIHWPSILSTTP